ncbi:capsular biosynthesis protein [Rhizobium sp. CG5]|uniref:capsule biosynthesis protein n=1 Tax=Rhizobium sp. CG5 TaxID=2726076 RepID=UPI00203376F3|nr:capsular biosynthesis protein [Rhizobium sp. CG5]MCM2477161.1 capsular biosynthesis protein [Rhizobium sp. CG5]
MRHLTLLFLQGPASPFLKDLARAAERRGAKVLKIHFCLGDAGFWWPRKADWFTGRPAEWPDFLTRYVTENGVTDIVMLGDGRPRHAAAVAVARHLRIKAHIFEHGYLRPDWLTLEPFGMSSKSCFPADATSIRTLAEGQADPPVDKRFASSFLTYALYDLAFHIPNVMLGWLVHPHYRAHGAVHPLVEYAGWIGKALTVPWRSRSARRVEQRYRAGSPDFFLFPLQLPGDYQIRVHAPMGDLFKLVAAVIGSFARHAPLTTRLLFKVHPIDNGLSRWSTRIGQLARHHGVEGRIDLIDGGDLDSLIARSVGVVTVNSTVGLTALLAHKPVIALAPAVYDVAGLTHHASLASFWQAPTPPEPDMPSVLVRAMARTIQVRGGLIGREAMQTGADAMAQRLFEEVDLLPVDSPPDRSHFRYEAELSIDASGAGTTRSGSV